MKRLRMHALLLPALTAVLAVGCRSGRPAPEACAPVPAGPIAGPVDLAGSFRVSVVATEGARAGTTIDGSLTLMDHDADGTSASGFAMRYLGYAELDLGSVGAVRLGSVASQDETQPGVVVFEREVSGGHEVMMRFGSEANRMGVTRFDGGYTVFRVHRLSGGNLAGSWASGTMRDEAGGYFCGERM